MPSLPNRQRLLTMPCDVPRLIKLRFRGHAAGVADRAATAWTDPAVVVTAPAGFFHAGGRESFSGVAVTDARAWLTDWPYRVLARESVMERFAEDAGPMTPRQPTAWSVVANPDPVLFARIVSALATIVGMDAAGFAMIVESLTGEFDLGKWRESLGGGNRAILDRRLVALYRYLVQFFDVPSQITDTAAKHALAAKRFIAGDPGDAIALGNARELTGRKEMTMSEYRSLYAQGVSASLKVLASASAIGATVIDATRPGLLRLLRVDESPSAIPPSSAADAELLLAQIESHVRAGGSFGAHEHAEPDALARLASGTLSVPEMAPIARHLFVCQDRRCSTFLRAEVGGREAARKSLLGPMSEPPPRKASMAVPRFLVAEKLPEIEPDMFGDRLTPQPASVSIELSEPEPMQSIRDLSHRQSSPGESTRSFEARDDLWSALVRVSDRDGETIDELVNHAIASYPRVRQLLQQPSSPASVTPVSSGTASSSPTSSSPTPGSPTPGSPTPSRTAPSNRASVASASTELASPSIEIAFEPLDDDSPFIDEPHSDSASSETKMNSTPPIAISPPLFIEYNNRRAQIVHPRFVIGRERSMCHLVLPDTNVSRQHAAVEWVNGVYFMVDLGSANGIGNGGHRIHRKQIVEGDRFEICGHTISFSFVGR